ncbi:riboflavin synthase [Luteimonas aquatica]|uniref:riboflavin synthase n=1 Tax=Luteimonas aquatica TaxID=450364 RepID=UPI001F5ABCEA|nr:riboflavin synthase [Luteimonas aquatica]
MFTGLIEGVGTLAARDTRGGDARLRILAGSLPGFAPPAEDVALGESISVNGVCLTVVAFDRDGFEADASNETLALTTLGQLPIGRALNLERAMRPSDRLGGHLVSGHVDGVGRVLDIAFDQSAPDARAQRWRFAMPPALARYVAQKGSICVDGVSLTVNGVDAESFEVTLIPHTLAHTAFAQTRVGEAVNLEVDLLARYVERILQAR